MSNLRFFKKHISFACLTLKNHKPVIILRFIILTTYKQKGLGSIKGTFVSLLLAPFLVSAHSSFPMWTHTCAHTHTHTYGAPAHLSLPTLISISAAPLKWSPVVTRVHCLQQTFTLNASFYLCLLCAILTKLSVVRAAIHFSSVLYSLPFFF